MAKKEVIRNIVEVYQVKIVRDLVTGIVVHEQWSSKEGWIHREGGPALIKRHPLTGIVVDEQWFKNGNSHRDDGPASIQRDAQTGEVRRSAWYKDGNQIAPPKSPPRPRTARKKPAGEPHV